MSIVTTQRSGLSINKRKVSPAPLEKPTGIKTFVQSSVPHVTKKAGQLSEGTLTELYISFFPQHWQQTSKKEWYIPPQFEISGILVMSNCISKHLRVCINLYISVHFPCCLRLNFNFFMYVYDQIKLYLRIIFSTLQRTFFILVDIQRDGTTAAAAAV